jgi:hypothetical protein
MTYGMNNSQGMKSPAGSSMGQRMAGGGDKVPKGYEKGQLQQFSPEQMQLFQQMFSHVNPQSFLSKLAGGDQSMFEQMEAPAMRQFQGLQGDIASRFSGAGMGARHGSGFQNGMNQATSDFSQNLQSQRMNLQMQALMELMGMSNTLLGQRPTEKFLTKKPPTFWEQIAGGFAGGAGAGLGSGFQGMFGGNGNSGQTPNMGGVFGAAGR